MASKTDLRGMTALVTGGSSGIGLEFCRALAKRGADIVMVSIQEKELAESCRALSETYGVKTHRLLLDLSRDDAPAENGCLRRRGRTRIDILINNAGIFDFRTIEDMTPERIDLYISLHIRAVTQLSRMVAARMAESGGGSILNMSSMSCWMPMPGIAMYAATKAYIRVLSRAMRIELRDRNVNVTVACPGGIATGLFGLPPHLLRLGVRLGVLHTPARFVRNALRRTLRRRRQYINGIVNRIAIVAVAILPERLRLAVKHRLLDRRNRP